MRPTDFAAATFLALSVIAGPAQAGPAREIVIPAGPLDQAVRALADGRILVVTGRDDVSGRAGEALGHVREATDAEWQSLTSAAPGGLTGGP